MTVEWADVFEYFLMQIEAAEANGDPAFAEVLRHFFINMQKRLRHDVMGG